jgi:hypothetical protein
MYISIAAPGVGATRASSPCRSALHEMGGAAPICLFAGTRRLTRCVPPEVVPDGRVLTLLLYGLP